MDAKQPLREASEQLPILSICFAGNNHHFISLSGIVFSPTAVGYAIPLERLGWCRRQGSEALGLGFILIFLYDPLQR